MRAKKSTSPRLNRRRAPLLVAFLSLLSGPLSADSNPKLIQAQQKAKLLEVLIKTPAMKMVQEGNSAVANWIGQSRSLLTQAKSAIAANRPEEAVEQLDEAIRALSKASSQLTSESNSGVAAQKKQFDEHATQVESYQRTLQEMSNTPQYASATRQLIGRIDSLSVEARKLLETGQYEEANKRIATAYKLAVEEISRLRNGQEVIMRLQFNSPREEFDYEQKRYYSNEILIGMLIKEERAIGEAQKQVDAYLQDASNQKSNALAKANASDYPSAIKEMEKANLQLNRALQMMGVPVF